MQDVLNIELKQLNSSTLC